MLNLIVGVKGSGKTKALIHMVNDAVARSGGSVVCVERGTKLRYDVKYQARLIDTSAYGISNAEQLYGFICGIYSNNYDVSDIFIDSALKICNYDIEAFAEFITRAEQVAVKNNINITVTASTDADSIPESIRRLMVKY